LPLSPGYIPLKPSVELYLVTVAWHKFFAVLVLSGVLEGPIPSMLSKVENTNLTPKTCILEQVVERYGYSQREVADHLGMHFTSISRIMRERKRMLTK